MHVLYSKQPSGVTTAYEPEVGPVKVNAVDTKQVTIIVDDGKLLNPMDYIQVSGATEWYRICRCNLMDGKLSGARVYHLRPDAKTCLEDGVANINKKIQAFFSPGDDDHSDDGDDGAPTRAAPPQAASPIPVSSGEEDEPAEPIPGSSDEEQPLGGVPANAHPEHIWASRTLPPVRRGALSGTTRLVGNTFPPAGMAAKFRGLSMALKDSGT